MAKAPKTSAPAGTVPPAPPPAAAPSAPPPAAAPSASPFALRIGGPPPVITRGAFGRAPGAAANPITVGMKQMPVPESGQYANVFIPADDVPPTVTDPTERAKAAKEEARKLSNRVSGIARRLSGEKDDSGNYYTFAIRTVEEGGKWGVCVYRVEPAEPTPPKPRTPSAPAAVAPVAPGTLPPPPPPPPAA